MTGPDGPSRSKMIERKSKEVEPGVPLTSLQEYKGVNGPRDRGHPRG